MENSEPKNNKSLYISFAVGIIFLSLGFFLNINGYIGMGNAIFIGTPFAIGFTSGTLPNLRQSFLGTFISLVAFGAILLTSGKETLVCLAMAAPILALAVFVGWKLGQRFRNDKDNGKDRFQLSLYPIMIIMTISLFELFSGSSHLPNKVVTSAIINASPSAIYQEIIAVDTVIVETNLLHKIGLPTPTKCVLTEEKVGGLRLCHFKEGLIVEKITALEKNRLLRMDVTEVDLGKKREWLTFDEDIYEIEPLADGSTKITRTTTYESSLRPRWYWEYMESLTIASQQDFVFRNLQNDILKENDQASLRSAD